MLYKQCNQVIVTFYTLIGTTVQCHYLHFATILVLFICTQTNQIYILLVWSGDELRYLHLWKILQYCFIQKRVYTLLCVLFIYTYMWLLICCVIQYTATLCTILYGVKWFDFIYNIICLRTPSLQKPMVWVKWRRLQTLVIILHPCPYAFELKYLLEFTEVCICLWV